jgi:hypothetical protein
MPRIAFWAIAGLAFGKGLGISVSFVLRKGFWLPSKIPIGYPHKNLTIIFSIK